MSLHESKLTARVFRRRAKRFDELGLHEEAKVMREKADAAEREHLTSTDNA